MLDAGVRALDREPRAPFIASGTTHSCPHAADSRELQMTGEPSVGP